MASEFNAATAKARQFLEAFLAEPIEFQRDVIAHLPAHTRRVLADMLDGKHPDPLTDFLLWLRDRPGFGPSTQVTFLPRADHSGYLILVEGEDRIIKQAVPLLELQQGKTAFPRALTGLRGRIELAEKWQGNEE